MTLGVNPWDIYHNGAWYNRDGSGGPLPIGDYDSHAAEHAAMGVAARNNASVALLGDSIAANCSVVASTGNTTTDRGWLPWALTYLGHPWDFQPTNNFGVSGATLITVLSDQLPLLREAARSTEFSRIFLSVGTNDTNAGHSYSDIISRFEALFDAIHALGAMPVHTGIRPRGSDASLLDAKKLNMRINEWLAARGQAGDIEYIDASEVYADNSTAFGNCLAATMYDSILHPGGFGACREGKVISDYYTVRGIGPDLKFATQSADLFDRTNNPYGSLFDNPLLSGGTTAPTGMTTSGGTWSKVSRTLSNGQTRSDPSCALAASTTHYLYDNWQATGAWSASQLQPGDILEARALVTVTSGVNINSINLQLNENNGATAVNNYAMVSPGVGSGIPDGNHTLYLKSPRLTVREYSGSGNAAIIGRLNAITAAGASGTLNIKAFEIRKVG